MKSLNMCHVFRCYFSTKSLAVILFDFFIRPLIQLIGQTTKAAINQ